MRLRTSRFLCLCRKCEHSYAYAYVYAYAYACVTSVNQPLSPHIKTAEYCGIFRKGLTNCTR